jgi:alpha-1,6-mannosyltransferase
MGATPDAGTHAAISFRRADPLKVIDVTEFFSERGGGVRTHLEMKGRALRLRGHRQLVIAPGPGREPVPGVLRVGGPSFPYDPS